MNAAKLIGIAISLTVLCLSAASVDAGFHSGGVGYCNGCHTMHDGTVSLRGSDVSSTCLLCHANSLTVLSPDGSVYSPGGDFFWLTQSYADATIQSPDHTHGHNIVALDFGLAADPLNATAPSSGVVLYQSSWMGCDSCHDPHGRIAGSTPQGPISQSGSYGNAPAGGNYRLLGGTGYRGGSLAVGINFTNSSPVAVAYPPIQGEWPAETDTNHADYGTGMSEWCANCHGGYDIQDHSAAFTHPSGSNQFLGSSEIAMYNSYVATGDLSGISLTAFDRLVPFERGTSDKSLLSSTRTDGPTSTSSVMCLTCHRAHASAFSDIGRWDFQVQNLNDSPVLLSPQGMHAYYGDSVSIRYNSSQGPLCEKCHAGGSP